MTNNTKLFYYWAGVAGMILLGHLFVTQGLFSLLPGPLVLALIITYTTPGSLRLLLFLAVVSELFSTLPPGSLAVAMLAPYLVAKIPGRPAADVTVWFFLFTVFTSCLQISILTFGLFFQTHPATLIQWFDDIAYFIPSAIPWIVASVSIASFVAIAFWQEVIMPLRPRRTIPRFKPMAR